MDQTLFQNPSWYHAIPFTERLASLRAGRRPPAGGVKGPLGERRLKRWREEAPFRTGPLFAQRLRADDVTEEEFSYVLGELIEAVQNRFPVPPAWLAELESAFSRPVPAPAPLAPPSDGPGDQRGMDGLLGLIEPLVTQARKRMHEGIQELLETGDERPFDPDTIEALLFAGLLDSLVPMLTRTLILELHVARLQGLLQGDTAEERYRSFFDRLRRRDTALSLLQEYPVLARQLVTRVTNWSAFSLEFLRHLGSDWEAVRATFTPEHHPGTITQIQSGAGDGHRGGRSVMIAHFRSGFRVVYKPRSLAIDVHFQQLLSWLNERSDHPPFRTLRVLDRGTHGWVEFVAAEGCSDADEVRRFYERQGGYLALLYALEATDFHFENVIAAGEHPVLIDLESLFHPRAESSASTGAEQFAGSTMAYSVLRVGLLPQRVWHNEEGEGIDLSGLGAAPGQVTPHRVSYVEGAGTDEMRLARKRMPIPGGRNRPSLDGTEVNVLDQAEAIIGGFTSVYQTLLKHRDELLADDGPLACFGGDEVRAILRPTRTYGLLLTESYHPDLLRNALDRDRFFDHLWGEVEQRPELAKVLPAERADLNNGDIPMFTTRPNSRQLWSSAGEPIADFFDEPGMALVRRRLAQLSDRDLGRQQWFIRASLATLALSAEPERQPAPRARRWKPRAGGGPQPRPGPPGRPSPSPRSGCAAARAVGDRLEELALRGSDDVAWLGLSLIKERQWAACSLWGRTFTAAFRGLRCSWPTSAGRPARSATPPWPKPR